MWHARGGLGSEASSSERRGRIFGSGRGTRRPRPLKQVLHSARGGWRLWCKPQFRTRRTYNNGREARRRQVRARAGACGATGRRRLWIACAHVGRGRRRHSINGFLNGGALADTERRSFGPRMGAVGAPRNEAGRAHARSAFGAAVVVIIVMIVESLAKPRSLLGPAGALPQLMLPAGTTRADSVRAATAAASDMVGGGGESFLVANVVRASDAGLS